jgi:hypothetical protein
MRVRSTLAWLMMCATIISPPVVLAEPQHTEATAAADEVALRYAIAAEGAEMVRRRDFAGIAAAARRYREITPLTPSGTSTLAEFYGGIEQELGSGKKAAGCPYTAGPLIKAWERAEPRSPTAYIVEAAMLSDNAWCLRGSGFADEVSDRSFALFHRQLAAAEKVLKEHRTIAALDPAFYEELLDIYNDDGRGESDYQVLLDEGVQRHPGYLNIYFSAARHYLPKWGGSYEAIDALARRAEQELPATGNAGGYVRVYWYLIGCDCYDQKMLIDPLLLKRSMSETLARFPNEWNVSSFALIACRTGDPFAAQGFFKALPADYDPHWHDQKWWHFCREVAGMEPTRVGVTEVPASQASQGDEVGQ